MAANTYVTERGDPPRLGDYRLLREVGRGGMGVVYEAVQESLGRRVALKVLPPGLAVRGAFLERFRREARTAGRLHHTNIVPVHACGEQDGSFYYAMQFIQGHGLDAVLEDVRRLRGLGPAAAAAATSLLGPREASPDGAAPPGPPPTAETRLPAARGRDELVGPPGPAYYRGVARLGLQAAEALAYAHGQGVLHRDVKPSNLLVDHQGTLWVSDFGLAKAGEGDLTEVNDLVGTLRYMAPERFRGRADARSDVYSLGATLYEMLTLRPAFEDSDRLQLIARVTQQAPPPPRRLAPDVPRDLETIVLKAMAREPADRYATAAALAEDLRRFLDDRLILARRASVMERLRRWRRRSPATAALALSVTALLLLLAAGSTVAALWLGRTRQDLVSANDALEGANGRLAATNARLVEANDALKRLDGEITDQLWRSLYGRARAGRFSPRPGRRLDSLDALARAWRIRPAGELRTEAIACLALTDLRPDPDGRTCPTTPDLFDMDFDDALGRYACADRHGSVSVRRAGDGAEVAAVSTDFDAPSWVELSRDGRFLSVRPDGGSGRLRLWDLDGSPDRPPGRRIDEQAGVSCTAFSPDGRRLVIGHSDGHIVAYDSATGRAERTVARGFVGRAAALDGDGRVAVGGRDARQKETIQVYDVPSGDRRAGWETPSPVEALVWRPGDGMLASVGRDRVVTTWDAATGRRIAAMDGTIGGGIRIAFSHGGDVLAGRDSTGLLRLWDPRTGRLLFSTAADMRALRFGVNDDTLAAEVSGEGARLWQVAVGREYRTLTAEPAAPPPDFSGSAAVHPAGRLLAAAMSDGVRLWDLAGGGQCAFLKRGKTVAVAFDGAGNLLASTAGEGAGVWCWRVTADGADGLEVGPAERLPLDAAGAGLACGRRGGLLAVATLAGAEVLGADEPKEPAVRLQAHDDNRDDVRDLSVSPDGRWLATCSHSGRGVRVWDVGRRAAVLETPVDGAASATFSPDGRWLAVGAEDCRVFAVGSWRPVRQVAGDPSSFSPDGALLALSVGPGVTLLVDPQTGKQVARLEDPNQDRGEAVFTPDGGRMAVVSRDGRCVHVWDLRLLRDDLAKIGRGMEGDLPEYPPAPDPKKRLTVTVKN